MIKRVNESGNVRLITNIRKPRKWRRYEYLLSSGTLYIDTKVKLTEPLTIEIEFVVTNVTDIGMIFGAYYDNSTYPKYQFYTKSSLFLIGGSLSSNNIVTKDACTANLKYNTIINTTRVSTENLNVTLYLFARNNDIGGIIKHKGLRIYSTKFYLNNTLIRDFVPAQYNGLYGMWDLVEDKFYGNSGTGTFTVGPEIKNYDEINEVRKTSSLLPAGVELYDYILSSGTLYIDTGWIADYTKSFEVTSKYNASSTGTRGCILSSYNAAKSISLEITTASRYWLHNGNIDNSITITMGADHISIFSYGEGTWKHQVDGGTANTGSVSYSDSTTASAYIFLDRSLRTNTFNKLFKIYYLTIKEDGVLVRNFLPCTYLGEPGMWDTVENKFYRNQGTGQFTLGSKITLKEYEYLLMQDTYINTGITPNLDTRILAELLLYDQAQTAVFGSRVNSGSNARSFMVWNGVNDGFAFLYGNNTWDHGKFAIAPIANTRFTIDLNKNVGRLSTGSTKVYNYHTFSSNCPLVIGSTNTSGTIDDRYTKENVYYFKVYDNGTLVRDFLPVSYNGTPGLWDKVDWKFYANAGSGSFTLGPEKKSGIFPISFGTLEYSEGSNISSSLLTVTGSGKTSTPVRAANNACTSGYKVEFSNVSVAKTYVIELDFTWTGNWGFTSDGNPRLFFLGTTKTSGGSYEWKGTNYITASLNNRKSLLGLVQSSPSGGRYHYIGVFTIPANNRVGYSIETRCDYSDGNGSFTYGNLKIYSYN